ncbi:MULTISPECIES: hypothetical protein [Sphingobacterium]|uniref:hypothetical protein n=1 Tax=Sphingobacterium TaxID=28453 RepID=UPI0013D969ED|nr:MULTISPECIES: hypothetical protein [unclassified Sphingobacterium]
MLLWRDQIILSVNEQDAIWANKEASELIETYRSRIADAINQYRDEHSLSRLLTSIGFAQQLESRSLVINSFHPEFGYV